MLIKKIKRFPYIPTAILVNIVTKSAFNNFIGVYQVCYLPFNIQCQTDIIYINIDVTL